MGILIDTNIFILAEKNQQALEISGIAADDAVYISAITASELLVGVHRAEATRRIRRSAFVEAILQSIPILPFTLKIARVHAELFSYLATHGKLIGAHDLLIAATALAHDCRVLTYNLCEFKQVPGLLVENPA